MESDHGHITEIRSKSPVEQVPVIGLIATFFINRWGNRWQQIENTNTPPIPKGYIDTPLAVQRTKHITG